MDATRALPCEFRAPDRVSERQLRAVRLVNEEFALGLSAALSDYLRCSVTARASATRQLRFEEFARTLAFPTHLLCLGMKPHAGTAILELAPSLAFPVVELLLGGRSAAASRMERQITEIEEAILEGFLRVLLQELRRVWRIQFTVEARKNGPRLLNVIPPGESVVAAGFEISIAENAGFFSLAVPAALVKSAGARLENHAPRTDSAGGHQAHALERIMEATLTLEAALTGPTVRARDLMRLEPGDTVTLDCPADRPLDLTVNGRPKFRGSIAVNGPKRAFVVA